MAILRLEKFIPLSYYSLKKVNALFFDEGLDSCFMSSCMFYMLSSIIEGFGRTKVDVLQKLYG